MVGRRIAALSGVLCVMLAATAVGSVRVRRASHLERTAPTYADPDRTSASSLPGTLIDPPLSRPGLSTGTLPPSSPPVAQAHGPGASRQPASAATNSAPMGSAIDCVDIRSGDPFRYYAQHLLASGRIDSTWSPATSLCMGTADNLNQVLCRDGAGGVYAGWVDARAGDTDIYLQHFDAHGAIATGWPAGGVAVCVAPLSQYNLDLASDDAGGVYLVWQDFRSKGAGDIYAQHMTPAATPATGWPAGGLALCTHAAGQSYPRITRDGSGGAFVVWEDRRSGYLALWGQRISASGVPAPGWPADGVPLTRGTVDEVAPALCSDSSGAVTVVWRTESPAGMGLRAARLDPGYSPAGGTVPAQHALAEEQASVGTASVVATRAGRTFVAWASWPGGGAGGEASLHLQRLGAGGAPDPAWPAGGALVCASALGRGAPRVVAQADSGAILAWEDFRSGSSDIYAQRIDARGAVAAGWTVNGVAVCVG